MIPRERVIDLITHLFYAHKNVTPTFRWRLNGEEPVGIIGECDHRRFTISVFGQNLWPREIFPDRCFDRYRTLPDRLQADGPFVCETCGPANLGDFTQMMTQMEVLGLAIMMERANRAC